MDGGQEDGTLAGPRDAALEAVSHVVLHKEGLIDKMCLNGLERACKTLDLNPIGRGAEVGIMVKEVTSGLPGLYLPCLPKSANRLLAIV